MSAIKTKTEQLIFVGETLVKRCSDMENLLDEYSGNLLLLKDCIYTSNIPRLSGGIAERINDLRRHIAGISLCAEKLNEIAAVYEETERRNVDESDTVNRG